MFKLLISLLLTFTLPTTNAENIKAPAGTVYVCVSTSSVAYHSDKDCKGLSRCTHKIVSVSDEDAVKKYKKRQCKICN